MTRSALALPKRCVDVMDALHTRKSMSTTFFCIGANFLLAFVQNLSKLGFTLIVQVGWMIGAQLIAQKGIERRQHEGIIGKHDG